MIFRELNFINQRNEPITRKSMSKLVMQPSFRAEGQTHVKWQTFEKPENKRNVWQSVYPSLTAIHSSLIFRFLQMCTISHVFGQQLLNLATNFDMLFLMIGFISLVNEIQFMLISSHHICIRSVGIWTPQAISCTFLLSRTCHIFRRRILFLTCDNTKLIM